MRTSTPSFWQWEQGDQPGFSPRRVAVPAPVHARLPGARPDVVLGWFHRYPARFAADVVTSMLAQAVTEADRPVEAILDPFCGTGAVVSAGRQLGLAAIGVELTTLGATIGRLRLDPPPDPAAAAAHCERLIRIPAAATSTVGEELTGWLGDDNARLFTAWKPAVLAIEDKRLRRFALIALSQSLRPSSRWLVGSVKVTADPHRVPIPLAHSLRRWARQIARDCEAELVAVEAACHPRITCEVRTDPARRPAAILYGDARHLALPDASMDAIVTSPPYFVTYDYFDVQRLSYLAFDWPMPRHLQVGAKYRQPPVTGHLCLPPAFRCWYEQDFRAERTVLGRALRAYVTGLRRHLAEAFRVVAPGGVVVYAVANTVRAGRVFDLATGFCELLTDAGFTDVRVTARAQEGRRILPAGRNPCTGQFTGSVGSAGVREYVVLGHRP